MVDDLTGKKLGRASSGTFRTADVVGLDTMGHVIKTLQDTLSADTDPFYGSFATPADLGQLLAAGTLEQQPDIDDESLREVLSSNLCRCTGYQNILRAVRQVRDAGNGGAR